MAINHSPRGAWFWGAQVKKGKKVFSKPREGKTMPVPSRGRSWGGYYRDTKKKLKEQISAFMLSYRVFWQLLCFTKQQYLFLTVGVILIANGAYVPLIMTHIQSTWRADLSVKKAGVLKTGIKYALMIIVKQGMLLLENISRAILSVNVRNSMNEKMLSLLSHRGSFLRMLEREARVRQAHEKGQMRGSATYVQTLVSELESFIDNFIDLHDTYINVLPVLVSTLYSLSDAGLLVSGSFFLLSFQLVMYCLTAWFSVDDSIQDATTSQTAFQGGFQYLMTRTRVSQYPNYIKTVLSSLKNSVHSYAQSAWRYIVSLQISSILSSLGEKLMTPLFVMTVLLRSYLKTDMSYRDLTERMEILSLLGLAGSIVGGRNALNRYWIQIHAQHIQSMLSTMQQDRNTQVSKLRTYEGLRATGAIELVEQDNAEGAQKTVVKCKATVLRAREGQELKTYQDNSQQEGKPLMFTAGDMVNVIGQNGAGKSVFFNMVSGLYPGMELPEEIKNNSGFSLTCEQEIFALPQVEGHVWGAKALLYLLWPTEQEVGSSHFSYQRGTGDGQTERVAVSKILKRVNDYLECLQFRLMVNNKGKDHMLTTVEELEQYRCSFEMMSGGEKSKLRLALYFAMAEVIRPQMLLIDEPYNHIDQQDCVREAMKWVRQGTPESVILVVTHQDSNDICMKAYDKLMLIDKRDKNAVRFFGKPDEYAEWLEKQGEGLVIEVPKHRWYMLPG